MNSSISYHIIEGGKQEQEMLVEISLLILKEMEARQQLDRVLIVCPKALVTKCLKVTG